MNQVIRKLLMAVVAVLDLGACALCGCRNALTTVPSLVTGADLSRCLPPLPPGFEAKQFLKGKDIVTYHIYKGTRTVATICIKDLVGNKEERDALFSTATQTFRGCPAISTSMGGGRAVLAANRFRVEVVSLDPDIGEKRRDAWLGAIDYDRLNSLGNAPVK